MKQNKKKLKTTKNKVRIVRSKDKIILNKEKPTKYFFLQEKQKQKKKQITILENEQGKPITKTSDILKECTNCSQKLYTKPKTCENQITLKKYNSQNSK